MGERMTEDMHGPKLMTDKKGYELSHYIMAERCLQVEYSSIMRDLRDSPTSETLIYILEGGFKGFHNYTNEQMIEAYKEAEDTWYQLYEDELLHWEVYQEDPIMLEKNYSKKKIGGVHSDAFKL